MHSGNDNERTSLIGGRPLNRANTNSSNSNGNGNGNTNTDGCCSSGGCGYLWSRCICLLLLSLLVLGSVGVTGLYLQKELFSLQHQLDEQAQLLQREILIVRQHGNVIERFNSSVTDSDVLVQLGAMTELLNATTAAVTSELTDTKREIQTSLRKTTHELSETVTDARTEINHQVDLVKTEVSSYQDQTQDQYSQTKFWLMIQLAGTFTLLSCLISMWHMTAHLRQLAEPDVQRKILAILWMCPIYAITSFFSLVFPNGQGYLAILKDGYEGYAIYQFLSFLISVLGKGDRNAVVDILARHASHLKPPIRCSTPLEVCGLAEPTPYENDRALADAVLLQCQFFTMQFVILKPLTSIASEVFKDYVPAITTVDTDAMDDWQTQILSQTIRLLYNPSTYITIVQNISIFTAFAGLVKFYHILDKELAWCRPFAKFCCIKGVVFMTFWQSMSINLLAAATITGENSTAWALRTSNLLICLEMLLFSIAHFYCFPTEEWQEGYRVQHEQGNFGDSMALGDFLSDVKLILRNGSKTKKKQKKPTQPAIPEGDEEEATHQTDNDDDSSEIAILGEEEKGTVPDDKNEDGDDDDSSCVSGLSCMSSSGTTSHSAAAATGSKEELAAADQMMAQALEQCLGSCGENEDPDIEQAAKRLLATRNVLRASLFDAGGGNHNSNSEGDDDHLDNNSHGQPGELPSKYASLISALSFQSKPGEHNHNNNSTTYDNDNDNDSKNGEKGSHGNKNDKPEAIGPPPTRHD